MKIQQVTPHANNVQFGMSLKIKDAFQNEFPQIANELKASQEVQKLIGKKNISIDKFADSVFVTRSKFLGLSKEESDGLHKNNVTVESVIQAIKGMLQK